MPISLQLQERIDPAKILRFRQRGQNFAAIRTARVRNRLAQVARRQPPILPSLDLISRLQGFYEQEFDRVVLETAKHVEDEAWYDKLTDEVYVTAIREALLAEEPPEIVADAQIRARRIGKVRKPRAVAPAVRLSRQAIHRQQLAILKARQHVLLQRVGRQVRRDLGEALDELFDQGVRDPDVIASVVSTVDRRVSHMEARRIIATEITRSNAEATLAVFEQRGVRRVEAKVEWRTAGDARVCPQCASMAGKVFTIEQARGLIPLHASCRCTWSPASRSRIPVRSLPPDIAAARTELEIPALGRPVADPKPRRIANAAAKRFLSRRRAA